MEPVRIHLTRTQIAGPIGKTISRVGADAQVAHADNRDALEHLAIAEQIDQRGDALIGEIAQHLFDSRRTSDSAERESLLRVAAEKLNQYRELDELEESHWKVYATERIVTAREACFRIVERTESVLTRRAAA